MSDYLDFRDLIIPKIDLNSLGLSIPYVDKVVGQSDFLKERLLNAAEKSKSLKDSDKEKSVVKMKIELPKIKTKFPLQKEYGRVTVQKIIRNLDDPNVSVYF